jgi:hypothetical protein
LERTSPTEYGSPSPWIQRDESVEYISMDTRVEEILAIMRKLLKLEKMGIKPISKEVKRDVKFGG